MKEVVLCGEDVSSLTMCVCSACYRMLAVNICFVCQLTCVYVI